MELPKAQSKTYIETKKKYYFIQLDDTKFDLIFISIHQYWKRNKQGLEQAGLVRDIPAHCRGIGTR